MKGTSWDYQPKIKVWNNNTQQKIDKKIGRGHNGKADTSEGIVARNF